MINETLADADGRMAKSIEALHRDLNTVRTGRASPALLDRIQVEYYGTPTPINQMANISVPEVRLLVIQPWDRGVIPDIERALQKSDIGITPSSDGIVDPARHSACLPRTAASSSSSRSIAQVEDAKVAIRNVRRDSMSVVRDLMNEKLISEDDERRAEQKLDDLTKKFVDEADKVGKAKEQEVLEV